MKSIRKLFRIKLPLSVALLIVVLSLACAGFVEGNALKKKDSEQPKKTSCVSCHTDKKTLDAIAKKSGDPLYLVHSGDLTLAQLQAYQNGSTPSPKWK